MKPSILVCRRMFPDILERLGTHFEVEANQADDEWSRDELIARLQGKDGAFITSMIVNILFFSRIDPLYQNFYEGLFLVLAVTVAAGIGRLFRRRA